MGIDFKKMRSPNKKIYKELWEGIKLPGPVQKTWYKNGKNSRESDNSYIFEVDSVDRRDIKEGDEKALRNGIKKIFKLNSVEDLETKFHSACFGKGHEYKEILRLHSSSLCPFLIFSFISSTNPLELKLDNKKYIFTKVYFEYENLVIDVDHPSCVDIVLVSKDNKVILFLESKFSEYLSSGDVSISPSYKEKYPKIFNKDFLDNFDFELRKDNKIGIKEGTAYSEGIKQMLSHYIGLENYISNKLCDKRKLPDKAKIYLGEILFDFKCAKDEFNNYTTIYSKMASSLNNLNSGKIHVLKEPLKYSLFAKDDCSYKLSENVKQFYFGKLKTISN